MSCNSFWVSLLRLKDNVVGFSFWYLPKPYVPSNFEVGWVDEDLIVLYLLLLQDIPKLFSQWNCPFFSYIAVIVKQNFGQAWFSSTHLYYHASWIPYLLKHWSPIHWLFSVVGISVASKIASRCMLRNQLMDHASGKLVAKRLNFFIFYKVLQFLTLKDNTEENLRSFEQKI